METILCRSGHIEVLRYVVDSLSQQTHLKAIVHLDSELAFLRDEDAPGVSAFGLELKQLIGDSYREQPHEDILLKLEQASRTFRVLVLKTDMAIPYTSVFFELQCRYWSNEAEHRLQMALAAASPENPLALKTT